MGRFGTEQLERTNIPREENLAIKQQLDGIINHWDHHTLGDYRREYDEIIKSALTAGWTWQRIQARFIPMESPQPGYAPQIWMEIKAEIMHAKNHQEQAHVS